jgi:hypothetical protein
MIACTLKIHAVSDIFRVHVPTFAEVIANKPTASLLAEMGLVAPCWVEFRFRVSSFADP